MDSPAEFVARYAPDLVGAVEARDGSEPTGRVDAEVVRSLTDLWIAGPPYEPAVARCRRRLAVGGGDLVDLGDAPKIIPRADLEPERVKRLAEGVRREIARHDQAPRRRTAAAVLTGVAVLLIGFVLGVPVGERRTVVAPPPPFPTPSASPTTLRPVSPTTVSSKTRAIWTDFRSWTERVRPAVFEHLDPGGEVLGRRDWRPVLTSMEWLDAGRRMSAEFGLEIDEDSVLKPQDTTLAPQLGVVVVAADDRSLVPVCGERTDTKCERREVGGEVLWVGSTDTTVEVLRRHNDRVWVYVRAHSARPGVLHPEQVVALAEDRRMPLPH